MTDSEVREVLPRLVSALQQEGLLRRRPDWWPNSVPWTLQTSPSNTFKCNSSTVLRRALLLCHSHLSQHAVKPVPAAQPRILDWLNSQPPSRSAKAAMGTSSPKHKGSGVPYLEIYLCHMCNEEFASKDMLQKHQVHCGGSTLSLSIPSTPPASEAPSPGPLTVTSDDTSSSGGTTTCTSLPSSRSSVRPPQSRETPPKAVGPAGSHGRVTPPLFSVAYHDFVAALDLVPAFRAKKIRLAQRRNTECETIDLEEPQTPISPSTPRTPKLLISQLSRDASTGGAGGDGHQSSRRRLSYLRQSSERKAEKADGGEGGSESESDGESCSTSSDDAEPKVRKKSLLNIDLSSGLGQRVMKHIKSEAHVPVIADAEQFCRTPSKDKYQDRLRVRQTPYPITYKLTRKRLRQHADCHTYKFTREDKREFMAKMRTGLNQECRQLLKSVRKCCVAIKRLSRKTLIKWKPSLNKLSVSLKPLAAEEIVYWTRPKPPSPVEASPCIFPSGPTFLFTDIDRVLGLKRKDVEALGTSCKLLPSHFVSEADNAELHLQKLTVYRSLLTDLSTATLSDPEDEAENCSQRERRDAGKACRGQYGNKFPSLFSILSGETVTKRPGRGRPAVEKPLARPLVHMHLASGSVNSASDCMHKGVKGVDFKQPLKIEIPFPSVPLPTASQSSLLDDVISIRTTTSSDEESNRGGACCSMCATRNKCSCSPRQSSSMSSASQRSLQSPDPALPQHTPPLPSLLSSGLPSKSSLSSHPTLSPPVLSPVSQLSDSPSLPSPRLTRASASHSSVPSPRSQLSSPSPTSRSTRYCPEAPIPRPKHQQDSAPPGAAKGSTHNLRTLSSARDDGSSQRPGTRSNHKDTRSNHKDNLIHTLAGTADVGQHKRSASFSVFQSGDAKPTSLRSSTSLATINEQGAVILGTETRATRSGRVIGEVGSDVPHISDISWSNSQKSRNSSRSGSRSSERSSVTDGASLDSVLLVGPVRMLRSGGSMGSLSPRSDKSTSSRPGQTRPDAIGNGLKFDASASIRASRNVASLNPLLHAAKGTVNSISDGVHKGNNNKSAEGGRLGTRTSARNHASPVNGHESASRSGDNSKDVKQENVVEEIHVDMPSQVLVDSGMSATQVDNPFLLSKAQTSLFSSSIREQARRRWHGSHKSPDRGSVSAKAVLRSGNSFRMASTGCLSPAAAPNASQDAWPAGVVKTEALYPSPKLHSPAVGNHHAPSTPPQQVCPGACQPLSLVRKRLSPLQMLSVLESAKSRQPSGKCGASGKRKAAWKRQAVNQSTTVTSKVAAYPTRTKEADGPVKKIRLASRVE